MTKSNALGKAPLLIVEQLYKFPHLQMNYPALEKVTLKNRSPCFLMLALYKKLNTSGFFTKLYIENDHHIVGNKEEDE